MLGPVPVQVPWSDIVPQAWRALLDAMRGWINAPQIGASARVLVSEYADNATALTAGLVAGQIYRTGDVLKVVHG